jgi:hypothetical protein
LDGRPDGAVSAGLEKHHPDELLRIKREIDPVYEATAILWRPDGSVASRW